MAGEELKNKGKRQFSEASNGDDHSEMAKRSKSLSEENPSDRKQDVPSELVQIYSLPRLQSNKFMTPDTERERRFERTASVSDCSSLPVWTSSYSHMKIQYQIPALPGTQCQFGPEMLRGSLNDNTRMEMDFLSNSSPRKNSQALMSPESGLTFTPPPLNAQLSPDISNNHGISVSSGIESVQGIEMECVEYDTMQATTSQASKEPENGGIGAGVGQTATTGKISNTDKTKKLQKFLQRKFVYLKCEIMPREIANRLYNDQVIKEKDLEAVKDAVGRRQKCDVLIKAISHSLESGNGSIVQRIKDVFAKENYAYVFDDFEEYSRPALKINTRNRSSTQWKNKLYMFAAKIEDELDPRHFIDELVSEEVLELDEHQNILTVPFKPEKVTCLIKYLQKKTQCEFESFCKVIKKLYNSSKIVDELCSTQHCEDLEFEELKETEIPPPMFIVRKEEQTCQMTPTATAQIKFEFDGEAKDIAKMIVDENSPYPNDNLQEEAMDIGGYEIVATKFSSIRIVLSALSQRSEMQILKKCKQSPVFLMKLLQHLIKAQHLKELKERNIRRIFFEIKIQWPDSEMISKEDIVSNVGCIENEIRKEEILRVLGNVPDCDKVIEKIQQIKSSKECFYKFVEFLVSEGRETVVDAFVKDLKKNGRDEVIAKLENARQQRQKRACSCQIVKEDIVEHYTLLEKEMVQVDQIIQTFSKFPGFSSAVQDEFKELVGKTSEESRIEPFLRKLLSLPDDGLQLCLLEERLHATGQVELLGKVTSKKSYLVEEDSEITESDIRRNRIFVCDELEPKQYFEMLKDIDDNDDICDQIIEAASREARCKILLDFILRKCLTGEKGLILNRFSRELLKRDPEVLQYIKDSRPTKERKQVGNLQQLKENIITSYKHIVEEIEPFCIKKFFEERQQLTEEEIDLIYMNSSRRARAIAFINCILKGSETKAKCLMDSLHYAGYVSLLKKLQESMKKYKECPRIYHALQGKNDCFLFKGELEIDFNAVHSEVCSESSRIPTFDNWSLVINWVLENFFANKRDDENQICQTHEARENSFNAEAEDLAPVYSKWKDSGNTSDNQNRESAEHPITDNDERNICTDICDDKVNDDNDSSKQQETPCTDQAATSPMQYYEIHESLPRCQDCSFKCRRHCMTESPRSYCGLNPSRYDEIFDKNSGTCSPSTTVSRLSRNVSLDEENYKLGEDPFQADDILIMFDEGSV